MSEILTSLSLFFCAALLTGCAAIPHGVTPVENFKLDRYLGTWYEIARLDHRFERGLSQVSASYSKRPDGGVTVINRGFKRETGVWKEARGRAYFVGEPDIARLKVTFFWPFYGGYNVLDLDHKNYAYALVCGPSRNYLWILSRSPQLDEVVVERLIVKAQKLDFDTSKLIFVDQQSL